MGIRKLVHELVAIPMGVGTWVLGFVGVVAVRHILEAASSRSATGVFALDVSTFIHYALFYLTLTLCLAIVVAGCTRQAVMRLLPLALYLLPVIWLAPNLDLLLSGGRGFPMAYMFQPAHELLLSFFSYFGPQVLPGITPGIRIEVVVVLAALFWYVRVSTGSYARATIAGTLSYVTIFLWTALPSALAVFAVVSSSTYEHVLGFWQMSLASWNTGQHLASVELRPLVHLDVLFNFAFAQIYYLAATALMAYCWWSSARGQFVAWCKNSRPERVAHYLVLAGLGLLLGLQASGVAPFAWLDAVSITTLAIATYASWMWAVGMNDIADVEIDLVSNRSRPLVRGAMSVRAMKVVSATCLGWALLGGALLGPSVLFGLTLFIVGYGLHSVQPFRYKRLSIFANVLISLCCLGAVMAGFFTISVNQRLTVFPFPVAALVLLSFSLGVHVKDVKDIVGDAKAGIPTLLTRFGERRGKRVVGLFLAASFCLAPVFLGNVRLWLASVPAAVLGYAAVTRRPYHERLIFLLYFAYLAALLVLLWSGAGPYVNGSMSWG